MITVLYGSQGGNAKNLAFVISESLSSSGLENEVVDMGEKNPEDLQDLNRIIIVTSTYGDGEAPDNASEWLSYLKFDDELNLNHLDYAILGLGDTYYPHFCQAAKDFELYLSKKGAHALVHSIFCDLYYEDQYPDWLSQLIDVLKNSDRD